MILLSTLINQFEAAFLQKYKTRLLPGHKKALMRMKFCRTQFSPQMLVRCSSDDCSNHSTIAHSCGHRNCPHCQSHESQQWIENQLNKRVAATYYLLTFTLPGQFRDIAWQNQRAVYHLLFSVIKDVLMTFARNDKKLKGEAGFTMVLHTHTRDLRHHPHMHVVMPGAAIEKNSRLWRVKSTKYLFDKDALAIVFRAKFLQALVDAQLPLPKRYPEKWVADCRAVGDGSKAIIYLGRYLYKGVIQEKDILSCQNGEVTFRYKESKSKTYQTRTVKGEEFLWLLVQHVLPKGFRKVRNYGFLNGCCKQLIKIIQVIFKIDPRMLLKKLKQRPEIRCRLCGAPMRIVQTMIQGLPYDILPNSA
jgi:hypothetical protein